MPFGARVEERRVVRPVVVGLVAVVAIVAVASLVVMMDGNGQPAFTVETGNVAAEESNGQADERIVVYVTGCVTQPGVYELEQGARVVEAIQAAGGMTELAATDALNLAEELTDGEKLSVPSEGEVAAAAEASSANATSASAGASSASASSSSSGGKSSTGTSAIDAQGRVNINLATAADLETVSGIGPSTAEKIIAERNANGSFSSVDDLTRVSGIGEKRLAAMRDKLTV